MKKSKPTTKSTPSKPTFRHRRPVSPPAENSFAFSGRMVTPSFSDEEPELHVSTALPPTMNTFEESLLGTNIPLQGNKSRIEVELGDITTRLNQTLTEFERYDEPKTVESSMLDDVTSYVNGMPSGPIKFQLKQLLSNYKDMSQRIDIENETEKDAMMASLAEWFMDEMATEDISAMEPDDLMSDLQESLMATKMGFEKLKMLNRQIISSKGQNVDQVKSDKTVLQNKVVSRFKTLFNNKKIKDIKTNRTVHWKYASNEIVSLLKKVRTEGVSSIAMLEEQLENVIQVLEDQAKTVSKMQSQLKDKDNLIDEMNHKQSGLEGEIMLLFDEREKLRDRVRRLIKKWKATRGNTVVQEDNEIDEDETSVYSILNNTTPQSQKVNVRNRNMIKQRDGISFTSAYDGRCMSSTIDIDDPSRMIDALTDKILSLEKQIIEKETRVMKIENNYHELADVVKKSAPQVASKLSFDLDIGPLALEPASESICRKCKDKPPDIKVDPAVNNQNNSPTISVENTEKIQKLERDNEALRAECARVRSDLDASRARLAKTKWELITLRYVDNKSTRLPVPFTHNDNIAEQGDDEQMDKMYEMRTDETSKRDKKKKITFKGVVKKIVSPVQMQTRTPNQLFVAKKQNETFNDEFEAYASVLKETNKPTSKIKMSRVKQGGGQVKNNAIGGTTTSVEVEEISLTHQGVQTDPAMDPLGAWSNGIEPVNDEGKRSSKLSVKLPLQAHSLPAPPKEWENFDPIPDLATTEMRTPHIESLPEPDQLRNNNEVITFVERELERMIQGIIGFTDYLNSMIEKETDSLTNVNKTLRRALSARTILTIDQKLNSTNEGLENGSRTTSGLLSKTPTRIGRFELASNSKPSRYINNKYFASYSFGKRRVDDVNTTVVPKQKIGTNQSYSSGPRYNLAENYIQKSEAAAKAKRDSINPVEHDVSDLLKKQVEMIGEHAIYVLRGTCLIFQESFEEQIKEYSELHDACTNKIPEWKKNIAASLKSRQSKDFTINPLVLKRSSSERNISKPKERTYDKENITTERKSCLLRSTQSLSSIEISHRYLPSLLVHKNLDNNINRPEMKIPKAVIPRKGAIMINTDQPRKDVVTIADKGYDEKKRHKPLPASHRKLMTKQKEMLGRVYKSDIVPEKDLINGPRTVLELSQQIVEFKRKNTRDLPPLPGRPIIEKTQQFLSDGSVTKDKLLMHT